MITSFGIFLLPALATAPEALLLVIAITATPLLLL